MKLVKIMQVVFLGAAMFLLTACGETGTSGQSTSENTASAPASGVYVPNQTGKPTSEDIKDEFVAVRCHRPRLSLLVVHGAYDYPVVPGRERFEGETHRALHVLLQQPL